MPEPERRNCENCYWNDPDYDGNGFCDEKESWVRWFEFCSKWKKREDRK